MLDLDTTAALGLEPIAVARELLAVKPAMFQLRAKTTGAGDTLALLRALVPLCRAADVPCFANDRPDLALLAGCDGVHVGQDDLPIAEVRRFASQLRVGVSTHDPAQLAAALDERPDYVAYGPVFSTRSKENPDPVVGLEGLAAAHTRACAAHVPLVAIGGIELDRASAVAQRSEMAAVIGAVLRAEDLGSAARQFHLALGGDT